MSRHPRSRHLRRRHKAWGLQNDPMSGIWASAGYDFEKESPEIPIQVRREVFQGHTLAFASKELARRAMSELRTRNVLLGTWRIVKLPRKYSDADFETQVYQWLRMLRVPSRPLSQQQVEDLKRKVSLNSLYGKFGAPTDYVDTDSVVMSKLYASHKASGELAILRKALLKALGKDGEDGAPTCSTLDLVDRLVEVEEQVRSALVQAHCPEAREAKSPWDWRDTKEVDVEAVFGDNAGEMAPLRSELAAPPSERPAAMTPERRAELRRCNLAEVDELLDAAERRAAEAHDATRVQRHNVMRVTELAADLGVIAEWPPILEAIEGMKRRAAEAEGAILECELARVEVERLANTCDPGPYKDAVARSVRADAAIDKMGRALVLASRPAPKTKETEK